MNITDHDHHWMQQAIQLAHQARFENEVPVGAIVIANEKIIGKGWNQPIGQHDPTAHAEIQALRQAAQYISNYRLINTELYVTLEPCIMCFGAMTHARISRLIYGASDKKSGAGTAFNLFQSNKFNHQITITRDILTDDCSQLLRDFFKQKRLK